MREFAFYGMDVKKAKHTQFEHQRIQLQAAKDMQMKIIRFHVCHEEIDTPRCISATRDALNLLQEFGLLGLLVLNDSLGHSSFFVKGDKPFHEKDHEKGHLDKTYFTEKGYRRHYWPFVEQITQALADHPAIFAWELGNEYAIHPQPSTKTDGQAFLNFAHTVSEMIRQNDPNHLISTGLINTNQVKPNTEDQPSYAKRLYSWPFIDFGTVHFYQNEHNPNAPFALEEELSLIDLEVLKSLGKPIIVEEFGATAGDRKHYTNMKLEQWFGGGAAGFMQWSVSAMKRDVGVGEIVRGMPAFREDWQAMVELYKTWSQELL